MPKTSAQDQALNRFFRLLRQVPCETEVFNPWGTWDPTHDSAKKAPQVRRANLRAYLRERLGGARFLLIAEALGYQGGHFTGIPMTSERIVLGHQVHQGLLPEHVAGETLKRTSAPALRPKGFAEPTATIVWKALLNIIQGESHPAVEPVSASVDFPLSARDFVLWNAFAWHPFQAEQGLLSNRTPRNSEIRGGEAVLRKFMDLFPQAKVIAVGTKAEMALQEVGVPCVVVRHPSRGGARQFESQLRAEVLQSITI